MPSLLPYPALAPQDAFSNSTSYAASESYYSNEDIRILHDVVERAQEILLQLPEGERLATNALFRAYDEVLPLHGIDAEQDQHISRLVFRIGGERGDGSLFDKFKSVLSRMGIEVEIDFESDNPTSSPAARSDKSTATSAFPHTHAAHNQLGHTGHPLASVGFPREALPSRPSGLLYTRDSLVPDSRLGDDTGASDQGAQNIEPQLFDSSYVGSRFRTVNASSQAVEAATVLQDSLHNMPDNHSDLVEQSKVAIASENAEPDNLHEQTLDDVLLWSEMHEVSVDPQVKADLERLGRRASRAWNLFQLTKAISHWAICTEEKMERTAVARRHILRIRHFGPWAQLTAEAKLSSRRILASRIENTWASLTRSAFRSEQDALKLAARNLFRRYAHRWEIVASDDSVSRLSGLGALRIHQWKSYLSRTEDLGHRAAQMWEDFLIYKVTLSWRHTVAVQSRDTAIFARHILFYRTLSLWDLAIRSQRFLLTLQTRDVRTWLGEWYQVSQQPSVHLRSSQHEQAALALRPWSPHDPNLLTAWFQKNTTAMVLQRWQQKTRAVEAIGQYYRDIQAQNVMDSVLSAWSSEIDHADQGSMWATRAERYFGLTKTLQRWKLSLPRWDSVTRRGYVKCRWKQKALITRRQLAFWRAATLDLDNVAQSTRHIEVGLDTRRATKVLDIWKEECQELVSKEWPLHLYAIWLDEWIVASEGCRLLEQETRTSWDKSLTARVWNKWHSMSVQLHSHQYVVEDVAGKNARKSAQRILLFWKKGGSPISGESRISTLVGSSMGHSRASRTQDTSLWSRTRSGQTAASSLLGVSSRTLVRESDEDQDTEAAISEGEEMGGVINTPTRWTGLNSSLVKLPSTTPLAPLSTPFERELRSRYDPHARRSLGVQPPERFSVRATPRLSVTEARRIAEERRRGSRIGDAATSP